MKYYEALAVAFLTISSFAIGIEAGASGAESYPILAMIIIVYFLIYSFGWISKYFEKSAVEYASKHLFVMGRGISTAVVRTQVILLEIGVLGLLLSSGLALALGMVGRENIVIPVLVLGFALLTVISLVLVRIRGGLSVSTRKTSVEVEFPFLLALMRTLAPTHLTLYDMVNIVAESGALRAWSREIRLAKRIAGAMNISLFQALTILSELHPSKTVRDTFKRIVVVGTLTGTVRDVVNRAFEYIFEKLNARMSSLVDKLDLINGSLLFGFMFIPILLTTIAPLSNMSALTVIGVILIIETPIGILTYALLTALYPSGFAVRAPTVVIAVSVASIAAVAVLTGIYLAPLIEFSLKPRTSISVLAAPQPQTGMSVEVYTVSVAFALLPAVLVTESLQRKLVLYSTVIRAATDAAEVAMSLGENFATVFQRESYRYGNSVARMAKTIIESYRTAVFRKAVVAKAPTTFHASFLEALLYALLYGAPAPVLKALTESYENMTKLWEKTRTVSRVVEGMIIALSAMLGFFLQYLYKMFASFAEGVYAAMKSGGYYASTVTSLLSINPSVMLSISAVTGVSIILVSLFVGKTRGGSLVFGFRTALVSFLVYQAMAIIVQYFVASPLSGLGINP